MAYKTIGISQEAYDALRRKKRGKESFSDVILSMNSKLREKSDLLKFAGIWSKETALKIEDLIEKERRHAEIEAKLRGRGE